MGVNEKKSGLYSDVKWIGGHSLRTLKNRTVNFYKKCIFGRFTLSVGDYVLVSNSDAKKPGTLNGCDVAKIVHLYEINKFHVEYPFRAIVQWYSHPSRISHKAFSKDNICVDFDREIIEEYRNCDNDISLETIFCKCHVIKGRLQDNAEDLINLCKNGLQCGPIFVCRYKLIKVKKSYRLIPLDFSNAKEDSVSPLECCDGAEKINETQIDVVNCVNRKKDLFNARKRLCLSENTPNEIEFVNVNFDSSNKVSPIKIVRGRSVVRLSEKKTSTALQCNKKTVCLSKLTAARRNLNHCLEVEDKFSSHYFIVETSKFTKDKEIKMKLRISKTSSDQDPLKLEKRSVKAQKKQNGSILSNVMCDTPLRNLKNYNEGCRTLPYTQRKSILKSTSKPLLSTPKKNIKLSDVVEKRIFHDSQETFTQKENYVIKSRLRKSSEKFEDLDMGNSAFDRSKVSPYVEQSKPEIENNRSQLNQSTDQPESLPCREKEFHNIWTFLESKIQDQQGGCMYVSGVPGTGKTATVTNVIRLLQQKAKQHELPQFEFVEINALRLTESRQAYVEIYKQLTDITVSRELALSMLEKRFTSPSPRRISTVLLIDELDVLCNRRQDVVYNLLDWPSKSTAKLIVITIANTMDLPERLLMGKVTSRLGLTRLSFQPYTYKQLQNIVTVRLCKSEAFKNDAVELVARKVAAVSGDARRALEISRRAVELANYTMNKNINTSYHCVTMAHVQEAINEMISSTKVQFIKNCSLCEQIFLQAVMAEILRTGVEETTFINVYSQFESISSLNDVLMPTIGRAMEICANLSTERMLICEDSCNDLFKKILLNVSIDDIHYALKINKM